MKFKYGKEFNPEDIGRKSEWKKKIADYQKDLALVQKPFTTLIQKCPVCDNTKGEIFCKIFDYNYKKCEKCNHIFSTRIVPQQRLEEYYSSLKEIKSSQGEIYLDKNIFFKRVEAIAKPKFEFVIENVKTFPSSKTWIDLGSGPGELIFYANEKGWDATGYEIDVEAVAFAKTLNINIIESKINSNFDFEIFNKANVISLINVLEHVVDPKSFLKKITDFTCAGTYLLMEIPHHPSLSSIVNKIFPDYSNRHIYPPDHLHIFSNESLNNMIQACNLSTEALWYFGQDFSDLFSSLALSNKLSDDPILNEIFKLCNDLQSTIDKKRLSDTILILAQKV